MQHCVRKGTYFRFVLEMFTSLCTSQLAPRNPDPNYAQDGSPDMLDATAFSLKVESAGTVVYVLFSVRLSMVSKPILRVHNPNNRSGLLVSKIKCACMF